MLARGFSQRRHEWQPVGGYRRDLDVDLRGCGQGDDNEQGFHRFALVDL
jgi:hypothetical protein